MDTSGRFSSPALDAVRGVPSVQGELTPIEVATLLFEEAADLQEDRLLQLIVSTPETGVKVKYGRVTIPWRELHVPAGITATGVASTYGSLEIGGPLYERHGDRYEKHGILLLASDQNGSAQWIWVETWVPYQSRPIYRVLSVKELAELMATPRQETSYPALSVDDLYTKYVDMVARKLRFYRDVTSRLALYGGRTGERHRRIADMREPVDAA